MERECAGSGDPEKAQKNLLYPVMEGVLRHQMTERCLLRQV